jgi:DNA repair exonuclease SbcCD ATPase subunit
MSRKLRPRKEEEDEVERVFDKMVRGMRNEMNIVLWRIERSRDVSPEALKNMVKNGLDAVVGAVEKAMYGVSDGLAKERKEKEQKEEDKKWRLIRDNDRREERRRTEEERVRKLEEKLERVVRENEERWKERDKRLKDMEDGMEREASRKAGEERRSKERSRNMEEEEGENESVNMKERLRALENRIKECEKSPGKEDRETQERIDKLENEIAKERAERQEYEWNMEGDKGIQDAKESEKDMEKKLEGSMEQLKILNLDFGRECGDRKTLVTEAISKIREKVTENDKEECDRIMKGVRIDILGKSTSTKETEKGKIHTVPVLITFGCKNVKERMEAIVRKAGLIATFQWPKECMEFVDKIREKVETMGFGKKEYFTRIRPTRVDGQVLLRVETKRKEGGRFEGLAYWRAPATDKAHWKRITKIMEPERMIATKDGYIGP